MDERLYWLGFSAFPGIGPLRFKRLLAKFDSAKAAWNATATDLVQSGIGEVVSARFDLFRNNFSLPDYAKRIQNSQVAFLILNDEEYPALLKQIKNPPFVLYIKGNLPKSEIRAEVAHENFLVHDAKKLKGSSRTSKPASVHRENFVGSPRSFSDASPASGYSQAIAVVGTRRITDYGREVTEMFVRELVEAGFTIVSGLAFGVDAIAHKTAIENNGKTIAVLGCGVDCCSPRENSNLYNETLNKGGLIVSELPLSSPPSKGSFPSRNRIIAGLSLGVLVTEGAEDSGSLITADYAFKFNRKVFAVPGAITSSLSKGPNSLIEKGAKLVTKGEDILKEFKIQNSKFKNIIQNSKFRNVTKEEAKILKILQNEPLHFDEIVRRSKLDSASIGSTLSLMEIKGFIKTLESGFFTLAIDKIT